MDFFLWGYLKDIVYQNLRVSVFNDVYLYKQINTKGDIEEKGTDKTRTKGKCSPGEKKDQLKLNSTNLH
jgi:hypothetical protein